MPRVPGTLFPQAAAGGGFLQAAARERRGDGGRLIPSASALLRLDSRLRENPSVLCVIALQDRRERAGRPTRDFEAAVGESPADIGLAQDRLDLPVQPRHDL